LMWAASIPTVYYGYICNQKLQLLYWIMVAQNLINARMHG